MRKPKINPQPGSDAEELVRLGTEKYLRELRVEFLPVSALNPYARNPRTHSAKQIRKIADSIGSSGSTIRSSSIATAAW
jgi:hypothetical protein